MGNADTTLLAEAMNAFISEWGMLLNVGLALGTLIGLAAFGYSLTLLIMNSDNPQGRQDAISKLWKTGITTAAIGGFWSFVIIIYAAFF